MFNLHILCFTFVIFVQSEGSNFYESKGQRYIQLNNNWQFSDVNKTKMKNVRVQVYYESHCPDCVDFFTSGSGLYPAVRKLADVVDFKIYPFGKAKIVDDNTIECQHGEKECYGNTLHACALDAISNHTVALIFNVCLMKFGSDNNGVGQCARLMNLSDKQNQIINCANGSRGFELLKMYGEETGKVSFQEVPASFINGVLYTFKEDFSDAICAAFRNTPPESEQCTNPADILSTKVVDFRIDAARKAVSSQAPD